MSTYSLLGELTIHHATEQYQHLLSMLNENGHESVLSLDLHEITEMDSAGIQLLLGMQHALAHSQCTLQLHRPSAVVVQVLTTYGLRHADLLPIEADMTALRVDTHAGVQT